MFSLIFTPDISSIPKYCISINYLTYYGILKRNLIAMVNQASGFYSYVKCSRSSWRVSAQTLTLKDERWRNIQRGKAVSSRRGMWPDKCKSIMYLISWEVTSVSLLAPSTAAWLRQVCGCKKWHQISCLLSALGRIICCYNTLWLSIKPPCQVSHTAAH